MSFEQFVQSLRVTGTPRGDFIGDTKTLINAGVFPAVDSWPDLYGFMIQRGACAEAVDVARRVWREYKAKVSEVA